MKYESKIKAVTEGVTQSFIKAKRRCDTNNKDGARCQFLMSGEDIITNDYNDLPHAHIF